MWLGIHAAQTARRKAKKRVARALSELDWQDLGELPELWPSQHEMVKQMELHYEMMSRKALPKSFSHIMIIVYRGRVHK